MVTSARHYDLALRHARLLDDGDIKELHREVSRLARAAYGREPRYQQNYAQGMLCAAPKIEAWNQRVREIFAAVGDNSTGAATA